MRRQNYELILQELGYFAAPMAFSGDTEEVVLTVNGIKKVGIVPWLSEVTRGNRHALNGRNIIFIGQEHER